MGRIAAWNELSLFGIWDELSLGTNRRLGRNVAQPNSHWLFLESYVKNQVQFSGLANLALEYLTIPGTAVPSEREWSDGGNIISSGRQSISTADFRMLIFLKENLLK